MLLVGVGDEYLSEVLARHQPNYLLHSLGIQFVKDVVEQQDRHTPVARSPQEVELSQL